MALSLPTTQVAFVAGRNGPPVTAASVSVLGTFGSADFLGGSYRKKGAAVCLHGPVLKSRVSDVGQQESLSSSLSSRYQAAQPVIQHQGSYTRIPGNEAHPNPSTNSSALIDIEDCGDGCITFKYGAVEDLWDLDRLLEYLSSGAFSSHTAESFVRVVVELFSVPMSYTAQRKLVYTISSQIRLLSDGSPEELERTVSEVLAEAAAEFLPPSSVGSYSKGTARPYKRFSSRLDKWWKKLDDYFGVGGGSVDFLHEDPLYGNGRLPMLPSGNYEKLNHRSDYKQPFQPTYSQSLSGITPLFTWMDPPSQMPWSARPSVRPYLEPPKTMVLLRENASSGLAEGGYASGLDSTLLQSQVDSLEDVLRKTDVAESALHPDLHFAPLSNNVQTIPAASIQDMVDWEQEEVLVTSVLNVPTKHKPPVKIKIKKTQTKKKTQDLRVRGVSSTKSAPKKKSSTERRTETQLCDMFFGLPLSHKCSGVASFLVMRKNFGGEMAAVFNQVAVGFAGLGLAVTLHVVARMLSVNSTFDSLKLFGLIRGVSLMWLSAVIQSVRKVMLRLPAGCIVSDSKNKTDLLCLQQRLRSLSFTAMTVMVLTVVGYGI